MVRSAPAYGAAYSSPRTWAPPPYRCSASAGNRALGIPKTIAFVSSRKIPRMTLLRRTKRNPSRIVFRLARSADSCGAIEGSSQIAASEAPKVATSTR